MLQGLYILYDYDELIHSRRQCFLGHIVTLGTAKTQASKSIMMGHEERWPGARVIIIGDSTHNRPVWVALALFATNNDNKNVFTFVMKIFLVQVLLLVVL